MSIEAVISSRLQRIARVRGRIYPVEVLKNAAAPFVFYEISGGEAEETILGDCELCSCEAIIHSVGRDYDELISIAHEVEQTMRGLSGSTEGGLYIARSHVRQTSPDIRENEVNLYRRAIAVTINYTILEG